MTLAGSVYQDRGDVYKRQAIGSAADFELMLRFIEKNHISTAYLDRDMVFMRTGGSSTAVSYTHLDVYKRQTLLTASA